ncbi:sigma-70 family RNA polymerase sigma factor [Novosphingopyxis sp.]|uniref:sigma-70 family RNA polymerase sigma factor n=1 Tax=Novosphingopyxis sp. TaxID=2709690 RepID=UPI003B5C03F8
MNAPVQNSMVQNAAIQGAGFSRLQRPERVEAAHWRRWRNGNDAQSRLWLFEQHLPFARRLAYREFLHRDRSVSERDDFDHWATEGLLQALDRYDPLRGAGFRSFAKRRIVGNIANHAPKMSERLQQGLARRRAERDRIESLKASDEGDALKRLAELAAGLAMGLIVEKASRITLESIPDGAPNPYEGLAWSEMIALVGRTIDTLPEREAMVLKQHYFHGVSFAQTADIIGLSKGRISQLHRSGIDRLRLLLGELKGEW